MDDAEIENHRRALVDSKLEAPKTLSEESETFWGEISAKTNDFGRNAADAAVLRLITKDDLLSFWEDTFAAGCSQRRKLAACFYAPHVALPPPSSIVSAVSAIPIVCVDGLDAVIEFKRTMAAYPAPIRVDI